MIARSPIRTYISHIVHPSGSRQGVMPQSASSACCFNLSLGCVKPSYVTKTNTRQSLDIVNQRNNWQLLTIKSAMRSRRGSQKAHFSVGSPNMNLKPLFPKQGIISRMKWNFVPSSWMQGCATSAGLALGLSACSATSEPAHAEMKENKEDDHSSSTSNFSHGKQVYTDYSVIGIPGDGRCLFRAVVHGACIRSGKPAPSESLQRELADELRARVADEFVKRRKETEWFIEGNFDSYVSQMRKTHVWGGEPELLMASHVLQMPISVYMNDEDSGGLISIAEYGHEYSKEDPIRVLYHGFGHYDALHIPDINSKGKSTLHDVIILDDTESDIDTDDIVINGNFTTDDDTESVSLTDTETDTDDETLFVSPSDVVIIESDDDDSPKDVVITDKMIEEILEGLRSIIPESDTDEEEHV